MSDLGTVRAATAADTAPPAISGAVPGPLAFVGLVIGAAFAVPAVYVVLQLFSLGAPIGETWVEIRGPLWRTLQLAALVSASTAFIGTLLAWVTVRTDLPFRRVWRVALVLPLVLPSFVGAGAFIAGIAPGGIIHDVLQAVGITPPRRFRGLGASWLVLTAFTYPYVMLPVSARLGSLRTSVEESARVLGCSARQAFIRVVLPEIRPAVLAGALLVFLYTLSEFGAVQLLGYDTLTRVIFATRQADRAVSFAAAAALLVLAITVVTAERRLRGRAAPDQRTAGTAAADRTRVAQDPRDAHLRGRRHGRAGRPGHQPRPLGRPRDSRWCRCVRRPRATDDQHRRRRAGHRRRHGDHRSPDRRRDDPPTGPAPDDRRRCGARRVRDPRARDRPRARRPRARTSPAFGWLYQSLAL